MLFARADWLARWLAKYYSWLSSDVTKIHTPKSQGLVRFYHHLAKYLLKIHFRASFRRDIVFHFENIALSNFASLIRETLIWRPRRPSHTLKDNFIAWYYSLWTVKVLENVFRGIICSFAINNWSNLWRYWNQMFALFPAAIFVLLGGAQIWRPHSEPIIFLLHILKKNSAVENCTDVRLGQVANSSIFYNIWNSWLQTFQGFDFSFRWRDSENHAPIHLPAEPKRKQKTSLSWLYIVESKNIEILLLKIVKRLASFVWLTSSLNLFDGLSYRVTLCALTCIAWRARF